MEFMEQLVQWYEKAEYENIVDAILNLPESERSDQLLGKLAVAYNNLEAYDQAIVVLEQLRARQEETYQWQYRMGYALYFHSESIADSELDAIAEQLTKARQAFTRCLFLNPRQEIAEDCESFLEAITEELSEIAEVCHQEEYAHSEPEVYQEMEMQAIENHITHYFGEFLNVFHEIVSPDIHVDICVVPPSAERAYYTLVTMGMGAHVMAVPEELADYQLERAELVICLPPSWKIGAEEEIWYWPFRLLKRLARLPGNCNTWLGWGHTVDNQEPYAENTELCGALLIAVQNVKEYAQLCILPYGDEVNFYQVLPLYREEIAFKQANDAETLLEYMEDVSFVVDPFRRNIGINLGAEEKKSPAENALDWAELHLESIQEKQLPVEEITAYQHLAIYLRWCIEQDLMSEQFLEQYPEVIQDVLEGHLQIDLRAFLRDELDGWLIYPYFNEIGVSFTRYYYSGDDDNAPYYPADVDDYALHYFGEERYYSEEFQDEAYLFVPYNETYYQGLKQYLDSHYRAWCLEQQIH